MRTGEEHLQDLFSYLENLSHVKADETPDIGLYMNWVTTFMDSHLKDMRRHPSDKVPTKTMIGNYAKNSLLPPLAKKKYSEGHILMLVFVYYFKDLLSFSDIEELFHPITSKHFSDQTSQLSPENIYNKVLTLEKDEVDNLESDVAAKFARAQDTSSDASVNDKDREYLELSAFICELSFDVYLRTQMIEMIAGQLGEDTPVPRKKQIP